MFFGSPEMVVPVLGMMIEREELEVEAVFSQPDRPVGRKQVLSPTPVKEFAVENNFDVWTPERLNTQVKEAMMTAWPTAPDVIVLAAYGLIIPQWLLDWPRYGVVNLHPSLLPAYRGASPAFGTILRGDDRCGLTYMQMDAELDHGPVIAQLSYPTPEKVNYMELTEELFEKGARYLPHVLAFVTQSDLGHVEGLMDLNRNQGDVQLQLFNPPQEQDHAAASLISRFSKQDGFVDWQLVEKLMAGEPATLDEFNPTIQPLLQDGYDEYSTAAIMERLIRALSPWPSAWTIIPVEALNAEAQQKFPEGLRMQLLQAQLSGSRLELAQVKVAGKQAQAWEVVANTWLA